MRILPAFPGAGGSINNDGILDAALTPRMIQPTTFAEISGNKSEKTKQIARKEREKTGRLWRKQQKNWKEILAFCENRQVGCHLVKLCLYEKTKGGQIWNFKYYEDKIWLINQVKVIYWMHKERNRVELQFCFHTVF